MAVTKFISDFITQPDSFMKYERPPQTIDLDKDTDGSVRKEMIKSMAMASIIYEDDLAERRKLPFKHKKDEDIELLVACEKELQRDVSLISTFEKFTNLV